jgi:glutathione S-transferase
MFTLYYAPNTCSLASHIALEEASAAYALKPLDLAKTEHQQPDYLEINPKPECRPWSRRGVLTETPAMLVFIAQSYPDARLVSFDDPFRFAEMQAFNSYLCSTVHVGHAHRMRGQPLGR